MQGPIEELHRLLIREIELKIEDQQEMFDSPQADYNQTVKQDPLSRAMDY